MHPLQTNWRQAADAAWQARQARDRAIERAAMAEGSLCATTIREAREKASKATGEWSAACLAEQDAWEALEIQCNWVRGMISRS